jgi:hypothetical protein
MPAEEKPAGGVARSVAANPVFVVTALGLILYGLLRLANSLFYDPLAVKPEEVGLGYSETLSQSAVGVFAVLLTSLALFGIFLVLLIFGWALVRRGAGEDEGKLDDVLSGVVVVALLGGAIVRFWVTSHVSDVVYAVIEGAFVLWIFYLVWREIRSGRVKRLVPLAGGAFALSVVLTVAAVMFQAWGDSRGVRDGEVRHPEFFFIPFGSWGADAAWVEWIVPDPPKGFARGRRRCLLYLGRANGTAVFYDAKARDDKTLRVPAGAVVITTRNSRHEGDQAC